MMAKEAGLDLVEVAPNVPAARGPDHGLREVQVRAEQEGPRVEAEAAPLEAEDRPAAARRPTRTCSRSASTRRGSSSMRGDKVQLMILFRGREMAHQEMGMQALQGGGQAPRGHRPGRAVAPHGGAPHDHAPLPEVGPPAPPGPPPVRRRPGRAGPAGRNPPRAPLDGGRVTANLRRFPFARAVHSMPKLKTRSSIAKRFKITKTREGPPLRLCEHQPHHEQEEREAPPAPAQRRSWSPAARPR